VKYFERTEFDCSCCRRNEMDGVFLQELDDLRARFGKPLIVSSGYRCPTHNARVSSTGASGPHTTGRAADLRVSRGDALRLLRIALEMGFTGIGLQQKGAVRFIHLDNLPNAEGQPRPTIWSY
jgi:zinc D-Ala-D-Ala carboxypeptidase